MQVYSPSFLHDGSFPYAQSLCIYSTYQSCASHMVLKSAKGKGLNFKPKNKGKGKKTDSDICHITLKMPADSISIILHAGQWAHPKSPVSCNLSNWVLSNTLPAGLISYQSCPGADSTF